MSKETLTGENYCRVDRHPTSLLLRDAVYGKRHLSASLAPGFVDAGQVKLLFETVISAFKVVNTLFLCVGCVLLFFGNVG